MQQVVGDMSFVTHEAGEQAISDFANATHFSGSIAGPLRPATHLLNIDNNIIDVSASSSNNLVVGGTGFVVMPGVAAPAAPAASVDAGALAQLESTRKAALAAHFAANHPFTADNGAAARWLFAQTTGFQINIGNDHITGGSGADTLIGDNALILQPISGTASPGGFASSEQAIMLTAVDRLFLGAYSAVSATNAAFGAQATLARSGAADWSLADGYVFHSGIVLDSDTIDGGAGNDHIFGDMAVILPRLAAAGVGTVAALSAYPSSELGGTAEANYNYVYGFGPFGSLHPWRVPTQTSPFTVDADTLRGGDGNDVLFGEIGNDNVNGGGGDDQVSGGFGANTVTGGTGTNLVAFDRSRDTHVSSGGNDIARSTLDLTAGSPILPINWQSAVGTTVGHGMLNPINGPLSWTGSVVAPAVYAKVPSGPFAMSVSTVVTPISGGSSVAGPVSSGNPNLGIRITLTFIMSEVVTVAGGIPTLTLDDGGTAYYTGGSGTKALTFSYTVAAGQKTRDPRVIAVNLHSATITDAASNTANLIMGITNLVTNYNSGNVTPWISQVAVLDEVGNITARTINNDNGTHWSNVYDSSGTATWAWFTNAYDGQGNLVSQSGTNHDGTHWLSLYDTANAYSWSSATLTFDANWNETSLTGTLDNGSPTNAPAGVAAALDVALWFQNPYDANWNAQPFYTVPIGGHVELGSGYGAGSVTVTFAGAGTLQIDNSAYFTGKIGDQLKIGDVIDFVDITAGANATIGYTGNNSPGTLTVSDGTHTATIVLLGNYVLANFIATSDGHGGTSVVDPPLASPASPPAGGVSVAPAGAGTGAQQVTPTAAAAPTSGAAQTEYATVASVTAAAIEPISTITALAVGQSAPIALPVSPVTVQAGSIVGSSGLSDERLAGDPGRASGRFGHAGGRDPRQGHAAGDGGAANGGCPRDGLAR